MTRCCLSSKSFAIAHLAQLLALMPGWIGQTLTSSELDLASGGGYSYGPTADEREW